MHFNRQHTWTSSSWLVTAAFAAATFAGPVAHAQTPSSPDSSASVKKQPSQPAKVTAPETRSPHHAACFIKSEDEKKNPDPALEERIAQCLRGADALELLKQGRDDEALKLLAPPKSPPASAL